MKKTLQLMCCVSLGWNMLHAQGLTLSEAYEHALENSSEIKSVSLQYESQKEGINQVKSRLYPQVSASVSKSRTDFERNDMVQTSTPEYTEDSVDFSANLKQTLYDHSVYTQLDLERAKLKISTIQVELQKQELLTKVFDAYVNILKSQNKITLLDSYYALNKSKNEAEKKRYSMNLSNKMDLLQMKVELSNSKIALAKEKKLLDIYKLKLQNFLGEVQFDLPKIDTSKITLDKITLIQESLTQNNNFENNLEVQQAILALKVSQEEIKNAFSGHLPSISLSANYTKYVSDDPTSDYENTKSIRIDVQIPLYQGGSVSSQVAAKKLMEKAAIEDIINIKESSKIQYDEYTSIFNASATTLLLYKDSLESAQFYVQSVELGYENGLKSIIDLHEAKNKLNEVKFQYVENVYEMIDAYIGLLKVTNNFDKLSLVDTIIN